ncbi:MAG: DNA-directed RNA polymerase subunit A' [Methanomicrobium sp.]|nr:DNA-directed RNA polymerase subunit A' [Methanomicrobium sp.]
MTSPKRVGKIEFGLLSPKDIRKMSVRKIIWADTYDDDGFPYPQGLMDLHLGVIDPGLRCKTCGNKASECPGHFGHIELAKPVIHVGYTRLIRKLLRVTCRNCGRLLLSADEISKVLGPEDERNDDTISEKDIKKERVCPFCGEQQLKINFEKPTTFSEATIDENGKKSEQKLTPADIRARLEKIPDEDLRLLGINPAVARPEWTCLTVLPVPPVTMRPSIILENGQRSEDDLTHKLVDIIRINQRFKENQDAGAPQLIIEDLWELLQYHVTTYMDNEVAGCPPARHRSGRPLKTISQRLKGKDGRFRGSLSGKRVNFSSRTVISPDPNISIAQVGVPLAIANEMSFPIRVTPFNIDEVRAMVLTGPNRPTLNSPCGANYAIRPDGRRVRLTDQTKENIAEMLEPGWTVDRQLRNNDVVLFNRQPSLHRMSIMAHHIVIMNGRTFRLNPAVCTPYNADFDGDEMNLHVPQTEEARAEAELLASVTENILSPRFGGPVIGAIHDHISGIFLLTHEKRWFNKSAVLFLLMNSLPDHLPKPDKVENGVEYWTNKQIFSMILPDDLNMVYHASSCLNCAKCKKEKCAEIPNADNKNSIQDAYVKIVDGNLICGTIDKKSIGAMAGVILQRIIRTHGLERGRQFVDDVTKLAIRGIMYDGYSFGIDDEDLTKNEYGMISEALDKAEADVERLIKSYEAGTLEPLPGRTLEETLEMNTMQVLGKARDSTGKIAGGHLGLSNSAVVMAVSGARGSMLNLTQVAGCVGQQAVRGARINRGYEGRTLPHFRKGDKGATAHGFVRNSYKSGLTPTEFFFHAIGGREGLVDTAVRTSQSGYLQRRMINALQDLKVGYDGTVRTSGGRIIQFKYGEDSTDPAKGCAGDPVDVKGIVESILKEEVRK